MKRINDQKGFQKMLDEQSVFDEDEVICGLEEDYFREWEEAVQAQIDIETIKMKEYATNRESLDESVEMQMREFSDFASDDLSEIEKLVRYRLQTAVLKTEYADKRAPYNLIIECEDTDRALELTDRLKTMPGICSPVSIEAPDPFYPSKDDLHKLFKCADSDCNMMVIYGCYERPAAYNERNANAAMSYDTYWDAVEEVTAEDPNMLLVIIANEDVVKNSLSRRKRLYHDIASHHITLSGYNEDQIYERCISRLKERGYEIKSGFKKALYEYICCTYQDSEIGGTRYVSQLVNTLTNNFYSTKTRLNASLTKDALPEYRIAKPLSRKEAFAGLNEMVGLTELKKKIRHMVSEVDYEQKLKEEGVELNRYNRHMLFVGNPGTGKTTVGKMIAKILHAYGVIKYDKFTYLERKDLVGSYIGQTEDKTNIIFKNAFGGVVMIDEAYSLATGKRGGENDKRDFGNRVIEILLTAMEEHKDDTVFIFAGYPDPMRGFIDSNPGLKSRIGYTFDFCDYTPEELTEIFRRSFAGKGMNVEEDALEKVKELMAFYTAMPDFGNGRFVDSVVGRTLERKASGNYKADLLTIRKKDIPDIRDMGSAIMMDVNPDDIAQTKKAVYRTAVHEIGHAIASIKTGRMPSKISIKASYADLGRVELNRHKESPTERELKGKLVTFLSGKNAEKAVLGEHSVGCQSDYRGAKKLADYMIKDLAMGEIGVTTGEDLIKEADSRSMELMKEYKDFIKKTAHELIKKGEMTGKELAAMM